MFIRIVRVDAEAQKLPFKVESLWQCQGFHIYPQDDGRVILGLEGPEKSIEIDRTIAEFFVLNEAGQIVDRYPVVKETDE